MTDDLVKRLREHINSIPVRNIQGRTFHGWEPDTLIEQAADRIEALEKALSHIYAWYPISVTQPHQTINDMREFARAALKGDNVSRETSKGPNGSAGKTPPDVA